MLKTLKYNFLENLNRIFKLESVKRLTKKMSVHRRISLICYDASYP